MLSDAARYLAYKRTRNCTAAASARGAASLQEVLRPDARFPATREDLVKDHGWKVVDLDDRTRVHATRLIEKLPSRSYRSLADVLSEIEIPAVPTSEGLPNRPISGPK